VRMPPFGQMFAVVALAVAISAAPSASSWASQSKQTPLPELVASVPGSDMAYVVSVSTSACGGAACVSLAQVDVTGAGYSIRTLPPLATAPGSLVGGLQTLTFSTPSDGYLTVSSGPNTELWVTTDGARSWHQRLRVSYYPYFNVYATPRHVYAIIGACSGMGVCRDQRLLSAPPSGVPWTRSSPPVAAVMVGMGLAAYGNDVWIQQPQPVGTLFLHSSDAGRSFTKWKISYPFTDSTCAMTASSALQIWARCSTGMDAVLLSSADGAHHWHVINTRQPLSNTSGGYFDPATARRAFLDVGVQALAPKDDLLRLSPSGTSTPVGRLGCEIVTGLDFIDALDGLAACQRTGQTRSAVLLVTSDGGGIWVRYRS
jgi:hypothetical protein